VTRLAAYTTPNEGLSTSRESRDSDRVSIAWPVIAAAGFNAALAVVNAHFYPITPSTVIAAEILLLISVHLIAFWNFSSAMSKWYVLLLALVGIFIVRTLISGEFEPKYLRDVALIPSFVLLGMAYTRRSTDATVWILHLIVSGIFAIELLAVDVYEYVLGVKDYYISTRGNVVDEFWNPDSDLYFSATRPQARFVPLLEGPRTSSVFLEPVSLGNYCVIASSYVLARSNHLSGSRRVFYGVSIILMLIGCDGRLAIVTTMLLLGLAAAARSSSVLQSYPAWLYLPVLCVIVPSVVMLGGFHTGEDDFEGRLAHTVAVLANFDRLDWLGLSSKQLLASMDSGLAYLIISQSLPGLAMLWAFIFFPTKNIAYDRLFYSHAIALYLSVTMMVSYSIVTIKTAGLMWFVLGTMITSNPKLAGWNGKRS
jgi:putative polymerase